MTWPIERAENIAGRVKSIFTRPEITYAFLQSPVISRCWSTGYCPAHPLLVNELRALSPQPFIFRDFEAGELADIYLVTCCASMEDVRAIWELREKVGDSAIIAVWLWDNHWGHLENIQSALAADFVFVSHDYEIKYLFQPVSVVARHIPACSAQWTTEQAQEYFFATQSATRKHKLLINYVKYENSSQLRQRVLADYERDLDCADVFLMERSDRSRYAGLGPRERFEEWARYKATVIVPVSKDLSTRVFDSLLAGLIPIVPGYIADFDAVIPLDMQEKLGIVRVDSLELPEIKQAAATALALFDEQGAEGALARHRYALEHHMLINRVTDMLYPLWLLGTGELSVDFSIGDRGPALYLGSPP